jgi:hypothetical protein
MTIPYAAAAREEVTKVLRRFGCESIGFMDDFEKHEVLLAFTHRGRQVQLDASAKGWAQMYLKENPWTYSRRSQRVEYEQAPLRQGHIAHLHLTRCHEKTRLWRTPSALPLNHGSIYLAAAPLCCARRSRNRSCRWRDAGNRREAIRRSHQHSLEAMSGAPPGHNRPRKNAPRARAGAGLDRENEKSISTAVEGLAWNINIWPPCCITNQTLRHRGESANATSLVASCDISILMSRNWLALVGSQCWGRDAYGSNCSASNHL